MALRNAAQANTTQHCPCGSERLFSQCCLVYLRNKALPATAEVLMRSRYSAYTQLNIDYIQQTMKGNALKRFDYASAKQWARAVQWLGLTVLPVAPNKTNASIAQVEFIARFKHDGTLQTLHEISQFERTNGRWYYVDGTSGRLAGNASCPCGSGKKFKRCCNPKN